MYHNVIILEIKRTINERRLNHPETTPPPPVYGKNDLPENQSAVPERLGATGHLPLLSASSSWCGRVGSCILTALLYSCSLFHRWLTVQNNVGPCALRSPVIGWEEFWLCCFPLCLIHVFLSRTQRSPETSRARRRLVSILSAWNSKILCVLGQSPWACAWSHNWESSHFFFHSP